MTLKTLASQTGGETTFGPADLKPALNQAAAAGTGYYMVTYTKADTAADKVLPMHLPCTRAGERRGHFANLVHQPAGRDRRVVRKRLVTDVDELEHASSELRSGVG